MNGKGKILSDTQAFERVMRANTAELNAMERMLRRAKGFVLAFARCNYPTLRSRLVADLRARLEATEIEIVEVDLPSRPLDLNLAQFLARRVAAVKSKRSCVLFVYGLERLLPLSLDTPPILHRLNWGRGAFGRLPCPVVFWLPTQALQLIGRKAADFWSWRGGSYEFIPDEETLENTLHEFVYDGRGPLTDATRWERIYTLEALLTDYPGDGTERERARADILHRLAELYRSLGDSVHATHCLESEINVRQRMKDREGLAIVYDELIQARGFRELEQFYLPADQAALLPQLDRYLPVLVAIPAPLTTPEGDIAFAELDGWGEWQGMTEAAVIGYEDIHGEGPPLALVRLNPPTVAALGHTLNRWSSPVLHFTGFSQQLPGQVLEGPEGQAFATAPEVVLVFEDENGQAAFLETPELVAMLSDSQVKLVILNASETADIASILHAQANIPAVLATRDQITDDEGKLFARCFYTRLALGFTVGQAVDSTKKAIVQAYREEWLRSGKPTAAEREAFGQERAEIITLFGDLDLHLELPKQEPRPDRPLILSGEPPTIGLPRITDFVGRGQELVALAGELAQPEARPIVLQGLGGVGKSWLAAELAHRFSWRFPDGVLWTNLSPHFTLSGLLSGLDRLLGTKSDYGVPQAVQRSQIGEALTSHRCLIVLDGAEVLTTAAEERLIPLLSELPSHATSRVILTSRKQLPLEEAKVWPVEGLSREDAGRLLMTEARERGIVEQVVERFGVFLEYAAGHPLFIRLIVGLVAQDGVKVALERLGDLTGPFADAVEALVGSVIESLSVEEQKLLGQLTVFRGAWDKASLAAVVGEGAEAGLRALVERSLVERDASGRYWMHLIIATYARRRLALPDLYAEAARHHAQYYLAYTQEHRGDYDALAVELNNIRAGFTWASAKATRDDAMVRDYVLAMFDFLYVRGYWDEALRWSEEATHACQGLDDKVGLATMYNNIGEIHWARGDYYAALRLLMENITLQKQLGDRAGLSDSYNIVGLVHKALGDYAIALEWYEKSIAIKKELDDKEGLAECYNNVGIIYKARGEYDIAVEWYMKSVAIKEELGDRAALASTYNNIGLVYKVHGDYDTALEWYERSVIIKEELGDRAGLARSYHNIGNIYQVRGDYKVALEWYEKSVAIKEELGDKAGLARSYNNIGRIYQARDEYEVALEWYEKSIAIKEELGDKAGLAKSYNNVGEILRLYGDYSTALEWYQKSIAIKQELGDKAGLAKSYNNIGLVYEVCGDYEIASEWYNRAAALQEELGGYEL
jgi:tetratricopeptide (TPR) repeat protein